MLYEEIENLIKDEKNFPDIFKLLTEDIEQVEYYTNMVAKNSLATNGEEVMEAMNKLNGAYNRLSVASKIADSEKKGRQEQKQNAIKIDGGVDGKKVTDGDAKNQASAYAQPYRRLRNILSAYANDADKSISNLQSILKYLGITYHKPSE